MSVGKTNYKGRQKDSYFFKVHLHDLEGNIKVIKREGFKTQKQAFLAEEKTIHEWNDNQKPAKTVVKLSHVIDEWLHYYRIGVKETTSANAVAYIKRYITGSIIDKDIHSYTREDLKEWQKGFLKRDLTAWTQRRTIQMMKEIFTYAVNEFNLVGNPASNLAMPRAIQRRAHQELNYYTLDQFKLFRSQIDEKEWILFFNVLFFTGLRLGEAQALLRSDYDEMSHELIIRKTLTNKLQQGKYVILDSPKTSSSNRRVIIPEWLHDDIKALDDIFNMNEDRFLFGMDSPFSATEIYRRNKAAAEGAGLHHIRIHDFRHSHASHLINLGADVLIVSQRLGHKNIAETLNTYSHLWPNKQKDIMKFL